MGPGRQTTILAVLAALLLAADVAFVVTDVGDDAPGDVAVADGVDGPADGDGASQDPAPTDGATGDDAAVDGAGAGQDDADDAPSDGAPGGDDGDGSTPAPAEPVALAVPVPGGYEYDVSGRYGLERDGLTELDVVAAAGVTTDGDTWAVEVVADEGFTDRFSFRLEGAGLDWVGWELDRRLGGEVGTTAYVCDGDAVLVEGETEGRTAAHGCTTNGLASSGSITVAGREEVVLGDGTAVEAVRLVYGYDLSGPGVSGGGDLELWLDPVTGLRLREDRTIRSVTSSAQGDLVYVEDVRFLLRSAPGA